MTYSSKTWSETKKDLGQCFDRWEYQVSRRGDRWYPSKWELEANTTRYLATGLPDDERRVTLRYTNPATGERKELATSKFDRVVDNARALFLTIDDVRLADYRGLGELMREAYAALPAPVKLRDPYELLGVRPDAPAEVVDAAYRARAKALHPDVNASDGEAMRELNAAYEQVKAR